MGPVHITDNQITDNEITDNQIIDNQITDRVKLPTIKLPTRIGAVKKNYKLKLTTFNWGSLYYASLY